MKDNFINEAFSQSINDYLESKDSKDGVLYNSFLVVVIRMLINIYGELDIINPYLTNNAASFDNNLMKFGAEKEKIDNLKRLMDAFYTIDKRNVNSLKKEDNIYFVEIQKRIIDLFNLKRLSYGVTESSSKEFYDLLYTPTTSNPLRMSYNFLNADNVNEVRDYYQKSLIVEPTINEVVKEEKNYLDLNIYDMFKIDSKKLETMNKNELDNLNNQIYRSLDISLDDENKDKLLLEKLNNLSKPLEPVTTGNGYVDILIIMSIIVTVIMIIIIFITLVF